MQAKTLTPHMDIQRYWCTKGKYNFHFLRTTLMFEVGALGPFVQVCCVGLLVRQEVQYVWGHSLRVICGTQNSIVLEYLLGMANKLNHCSLLR